MNLQAHHILLTIAVAITAVAAAWDMRTGLIPNRLVLIGAGAVIAARLAIASITGTGPAMFLASLGIAVAGALLVSLVTLMLYRMDGIGGGDVKLLAVVGLALGPMVGLEAELYSFVAALMIAPARLVYEGTLWRTLASSAGMLVWRFTPAGRTAPRSAGTFVMFRFGPAIFLGTLAACAMHWGTP